MTEMTRCSKYRSSLTVPQSSKVIPTQDEFMQYERNILKIIEKIVPQISQLSFSNTEQQCLSQLHFNSHLEKKLKEVKNGKL